MKVVISAKSELPIYAQIREQMKEQILNGMIEEGEVLPSIRQLAKELGVSVITTTRAYSDLEAEGFITSIQGKGSIVQKKNNAIMKEQYLLRIEESLNVAIHTARLICMKKEEIHDMLDRLMEE